MSRQFFRKATEARLRLAATPATKPKRPTTPIVKPSSQMVVGISTQGPHRTSRLMDAATAHRQMARRKSGRENYAKGVGHRWTVEEARAAGKKSWRKKGRLFKRTGLRIGRKLLRGISLDHEALRLVYEGREVNGILFMGGLWWDTMSGEEHFIVSERTALIRLGHLPSPQGYVPDTVTLVENGRHLAHKRRHEAAKKS